MIAEAGAMNYGGTYGNSTGSGDGQNQEFS